MTKQITNRAKYSAPEPTKTEMLFIALSYLTGVKFAPAARYYNRRRGTWRQYAAGLQSEIDRQHAAGFGFRVIDGRRVDR